MDSLLDLPHELVLEILAWLLPVDIVSMRRTCKALNCLSKTRDIWAIQLRRGCDLNRIPHSVYPLDTANVCELESIALQEYKFLSSLKRSQTAHLGSFRTLARGGVSRGLSAAVHRSDSTLIDRSGRFVVVSKHAESNPQRAGRFEVWDLGASPTMASPRLLGNIPRQTYSNSPSSAAWARAVFPRSGTDGLDIMVTIFGVPSTESSEPSTLRIYRIPVGPQDSEPHSVDPKLVKELALTPSANWGLPSVDGCDDMVVCYHSAPTTLVVVWNFIEDRVDFWKHASLNHYGDIASMGPKVSIRGQDLYLDTRKGEFQRFSIHPSTLDQSTLTHENLISRTPPERRADSTFIFPCDQPPTDERTSYRTSYFLSSGPTLDHFAVLQSWPSAPEKDRFFVYAVRQRVDEDGTTGAEEYEPIFDIPFSPGAYLKHVEFFNNDIILFKSTSDHSDWVTERGMEYSTITNFRSYRSIDTPLDWTKLKAILPSRGPDDGPAFYKLGDLLFLHREGAIGFLRGTCRF